MSGLTKVACIGEAMVELSMHGDSAQVGVAGDTLNVAIYLKRSAPGLSVDFITSLGKDVFSQTIEDFIATEAIGTGAITRHSDRTCGLYAITLDEDGERSFTYWRGQSAARTLFEGNDFSVLDGYDVVYLSGITLAILPRNVRLALIDHIAKSSCIVAFDSNYRPGLWPKEEAREAIDAMWAIADIPLPTLDDELVLTGESPETALARLTRLGGSGAVKLGPGGPVSIGEAVHQEYPEVSKPVDTTAAGDSFNGGYLAARFLGQSQRDALMHGHSVACQVIRHKGAIIPKDA